MNPDPEFGLSSHLLWEFRKILRSIYVVLIKAKINVLLPFAPLAILLHYTTKKHGWVFFFSLVGITPLVERMGYATDLERRPCDGVAWRRPGASVGCVEFVVAAMAAPQAPFGVATPCTMAPPRDSLHFHRANSHCLRGSHGHIVKAICTVPLKVKNLKIMLMKKRNLILLNGNLSDGLLFRLCGSLCCLDVLLMLCREPLIQRTCRHAAEHASAIMFAMKDKLDITLGVAIGSSTQISMFVIPFCVVVGWFMGKPMDMNFQLSQTATLFIAVLVVAFMLQEGTSNYFKELMLILCYLIVAASFFLHVDPSNGKSNQSVVCSKMQSA
ncbi:transporter [Lithospermum erythrorhizon]|uniref:Transporter n=1 Tax=Lithospermum erythrorhizon TaxID=34254 RepID=A0AAV3PYS3_LITER